MGGQKFSSARKKLKFYSSRVNELIWLDKIMYELWSTSRPIIDSIEVESYNKYSSHFFVSTIQCNSNRHGITSTPGSLKRNSEKGSNNA